MTAVSDTFKVEGITEKKFRKDLEYKGKRFYLCPPKPRGSGVHLQTETFGTVAEK